MRNNNGIGVRIKDESEYITVRQCVIHDQGAQGVHGGEDYPRAGIAAGRNKHIRHITIESCEHQVYIPQ